MATRKPPTAAETRKAFRIAMDAIGLAPDARQEALAAFKNALAADPPKKRNRRQEQNQAIRDAMSLAEIMPDLLDEAIHIIKRNDFDSGERAHEPGELGASKPTHSDMTGTPAPYYGDPTGEEACWDQKSDRTTTIISAMCVALGQWLTMARSLHDLSNTDVRVRASRNIPDCLACGDPCLGRVLSGFDEKCYKRFVRAGRPDRLKFIATVRAELVDTNSSDDMDISDVS